MENKLKTINSVKCVTITLTSSSQLLHGLHFSAKINYAESICLMTSLLGWYFPSSREAASKYS